MRVISGKARGLKLKTIDGDTTRPTKDMVKEALFSMLIGHVEGCVFLDLFAGSGAIGIEALSRGAKEAYFCDLNKKCIEVIKDNISKARFDDFAKIYNLDYLQMLDKVRNVSFDVIYVDPPYNKGMGIDAIEKISSYELLKTNGIIVLETDEIEEIPDTIGDFERYKSRNYGRNFLNFYSKKGVI